MTQEPAKFIYAYLEDMENNPKICFELHRFAPPKNSRSFVTKTLQNLDKDTTLLDLDAVDKIGFFTTLTVLHEHKMKRGRHDAAIVFPLESNDRFSIDIDSHEHASLKHKGEFYSFIPLKPFFPECNMHDNIHDPILNMRVGRTVIHALLE